METKTQIVPLFGEVVVRAPERAEIPLPTKMDLMRMWADAYELWMSSLRTDNTRRAYRKAWDDILGFSGKNPWMIGKYDVRRWKEAMTLRITGKGKPLSDCTIQQRLAAVSSFYTFVNDTYVITQADGREVPLHSGNPAAGKSLRPKISPYGKAVFLTSEEARALLKAIKLTNVKGLRDYALFLGYLFTARRNSEWRMIRWGDFIDLGGHVFYKWSGKGKKDQKQELPPPVWAAVQAYLKAAGRLDTMQEEDFIFTALTDRARRLPTVNQAMYDQRQALSMREVGRCLKLYCKRAGLKAEKIHVHTLRHTGAMLRKEAGDKVEDISEFLGHSSLAVTQIYLHTVEGKKDESWSKVETLLGL